MIMNLEPLGIVSIKLNDDVATLSYKGKRGEFPNVPLKFEGSLWTLESLASSDYISGVTVATLRKV